MFNSNGSKDNTLQSNSSLTAVIAVSQNTRLFGCFVFKSSSYIFRGAI